MNHWLNEIVLGLLLVFLLLYCKQTPGRRFYKGVKQRKSDCRLNTFVHRKKPQWVTDKVIYLKAINPDFGCRKIAYTFNRLYQDKNESVSKSFVYDKLKQHQYQILLLRRKIKHQRPAEVPKNQKWGMDLTTVSDSAGGQNQLLAIIDYGTRKCLCLETLESKHTINIIRALLKAINQFGKPRYLKTDSEAVFKSWQLNLFLRLLNIKHQYSDIASPWQNGRVERLIGTFKERIKQLLIENSQQLDLMLPEFILWYNAARPHNYLNGKTPDEAWFGIPRERQYCYWRGWGGALTGFIPTRL